MILRFSLAIKIIIKMAEQEIVPVAAVALNDASFCKNHPETVSGYFVLEQPWIKYCKSCALNVALCGRKI